MNTASDFSKSQALDDEIAELERRLEAARCKLNGNQVSQAATSSPPSPSKILQSVGKKMLSRMIAPSDKF